MAMHVLLLFIIPAPAASLGVNGAGVRECHLERRKDPLRCLMS